jgi:hypothetical protein
MDHCAIDLGGRKSQICVRAADGTVLFEGQHETSLLPRYLQELPRKSRVILETAADAFRIADPAQAAGHQGNSPKSSGNILTDSPNGSDHRQASRSASKSSPALSPASFQRSSPRQPEIGRRVQ